MRPPPLYDKKHKLVFFFTPKAACSFGVSWFFYQIGFYEECVKYHYWPHKFRDEVYNKKFNNPINHEIYDCQCIFLVRDPLTRAVSSYFHAIRTNIDSHKISKFLNKDTLTEKFTFIEFVQYLKTIDLDECNIHFKRQTNKFSNDKKITNKHIIHVENIIEEFRELEKKLNLKESPLEEISNSLNFHKVDTNKSLNFECSNYSFNTEDITENKIPDYKFFYTQELIKDVYSLYKTDFESYGYKPEI